MKLWNVFIALAVVSCTTADPNAEEGIGKVPDVQIDTVWTNAARFLSGYELIGEGFEYDTVFVNAYRKEMQQAFQKIDSLRLNPLSKWYQTELDSANVKLEPLSFYSFSGGDFLHLHTLYPSTDEYVMLAIEPVGVVPSFSKLGRNEQNVALGELNRMLRDIFSKSYFVTKNMKGDIEGNQHIKGMLPSILWGVSITGHDIVSVSSVSLDSNGNASSKAVTTAESYENGVVITFVRRGTATVQKVTYLACDISNKGIEANHALRAYLDKLPKFNSFIKAASYLPHYKTFSSIRELVLNKSTVHLQDDTGIPYKYFTAFQPKLYGEYVYPVDDFDSSLFQVDLIDAYRSSSSFVGKLPFSMGYHWMTKLQNQMVFIRN